FRAYKEAEGVRGGGGGAEGGGGGGGGGGGRGSYPSHYNYPLGQIVSLYQHDAMITRLTFSSLTYSNTIVELHYPLCHISVVSTYDAMISA
ncbi:hypothetical protein L9F63_027802, partial [Diploptera punctata]